MEGKIEERVEYERCACLSCNLPETTVHGLDLVEMPAVVRPRRSRTRKAGRKGQQTKHDAPCLRPQAVLQLDSINHFVVLSRHEARLAQSAERKTLNLVVVGSSPTLGEKDSFL